MLNKISNKLKNILISNAEILAIKYNRKIISLNQYEDEKRLYKYLIQGIEQSLTFDYHKLKKMVLSYINEMKIETNKWEYKYSSNTSKSNLYSSAYVCMLLSFFKELDFLSKKEVDNWLNYYNSFQSPKDGLFYDNNLNNEYFNNSDWWGARHLAIHMIVSYCNLKSRPKYPFYFLNKYYKKEDIFNWLNQKDWNNKFSNEDDIDNQIMNITTLLQYSREFWNDKNAKEAVKYILDFLISKINSETGMWGNYNLDEKSDVSRMVQFSYHLFPIFIYENIKLDNLSKIIDYTLQTQNEIGGYGVSLNSSACEDIDSIYILIKSAKYTNYKNLEIKNSLKKALPKVLSNMNNDGGFVFKRNEPFTYGHKEMYSCKNESNLFATWFRVLSLIYITKFLNIENDFQLNNYPGLEN